MEAKSMNMYLQKNYPSQWDKAKEIVRDSLVRLVKEVDREQQTGLPEWPNLWRAHWNWEFIRRSSKYQEWCNEIRKLRNLEAELGELEYRLGRSPEAPKIQVAPNELEKPGSINLKWLCYVWGLQSVLLQGEELFLNYQIDFEELLRCVVAMGLDSPEIDSPSELIGFPGRSTQLVLNRS